MAGRSTTIRDKHRAVIRRKRPPCGICGQDIDYELPYLDPLSYVVDHVVPLNKGGADVLGNKQAAHRSCNRAKSDTLPEHMSQPVATSRCWWTQGG